MHTVHTIMPELAKLRVNIAPVGFEIDRVVLSAKMTRADKVWLVVHDNPATDKAQSFVDKIKAELKKAKISVEIAYANRLDLFQIIKAVKDIVNKEKGNDVYVNVASGSKIQAIACMMACMMFNNQKNIHPFYAEAQEYTGFHGKQQSLGVKDLLPLPTYEIQTPKPELISALKIIKENDGKVTKKQLAELAEKNKIIIVNARKENQSQARLTSLAANIIQPLEEQWKFIEVEKVGRNHWVKITQEGINATQFLI